jgi:hypothetical protein
MNVRNTQTMFIISCLSTGTVGKSCSGQAQMSWAPAPHTWTLRCADRSPSFGSASYAYFASILLQREAGSQSKMMPPLAPNSRCAISIKNMLSNTSTVRIALYVLCIPTATASYAHGLSLHLRLYDLHIEKVPDLGSLNHSSPKTGFWFPAHGGLQFLTNWPRNTCPQIAWAGVLR